GGEEVKLLGLSSGVLREPSAPTDDFRNDLRDFAALSAELLGTGITSADGLRDPGALRSFLEDAQAGDPEARFASWDAVRQGRRRALVGGPSTDVPLPGAGTVRLPLSELRRQMEERHSVGGEGLETRVFRAEDLAPAPPPLSDPPAAAPLPLKA